MKKILFVFLTCLTLQNCLTIISKAALEGIDNQRNKGKNENCDLEQYRNYDAKHYRNKILPYIAIPEGIAGFGGMFYFYPNGIKMLGSFYYFYFTTLFGSDLPDGDEGLERYSRDLKNTWNQFKISNCKNQSEFFSYTNQLKVEIDLTKKENSQILGNNFSNQKTFESICKNNQSSLEEDFYQKLFFLYEAEIKKVQSKRGYSDSEQKETEKEIEKWNKKRFTKQQIQTILQKENLKYTAFVDSTSFEYPATVTCNLSFYLQYPGGEVAFKNKIEKYFKK
jgi:hypothetical protein